MQSVSSRIWTRVAYDDNDYTTGTSIYMMMLINIKNIYVNNTDLVSTYISSDIRMIDWTQMGAVLLTIPA